jgi:hypothetical protein
LKSAIKREKVQTKIQAYENFLQNIIERSGNGSPETEKNCKSITLVAT